MWKLRGLRKGVEREEDVLHVRWKRINHVCFWNAGRWKDEENNVSTKNG